MFTTMQTWAEVRRRVLAGEISKREACREYRLHWDTLTKILAHEEPPGYRRRKPRAQPALGPFLPVTRQQDPAVASPDQSSFRIVPMPRLFVNSELPLLPNRSR